MHHYPKMFWVWLTKHVSEFCGSNVQQYYWSKGALSPKCNSCSKQEEYTMHICRCKDPGHNHLFQMSVGELHSWLVTALGELSIAFVISTYLLAWGETTLKSVTGNSWQDLAVIAKHTDKLGWDGLLEEWITNSWLLLVHPLLLRRQRKLLPKLWGQQFIMWLHKLFIGNGFTETCIFTSRGKRAGQYPRFTMFLIK